ncbi:MAG: sigma 54-interacting transcriptional regulator [Desulfovibrionaceae bacterium]|jgi:DNA-binding NtrC family response regulator|nr:sigma 54-interacting transcriptional regulator [Desulfovibrionaceae bacterium]
MGLYNGNFPFLSSQGRTPLIGFWPQALNFRLMLTLIPSVMAILAVTGYLGYQISLSFLDIALQRNVKVQTLAIAHDIESLLSTCRQDLLFLARDPSMDERHLRAFLERTRASGGLRYRELSYLPPSGDGRIFLMAGEDGSIATLEGEGLGPSDPSPLRLFDEAAESGIGQVALSRILQVSYPAPTRYNPGHRLTAHVLRFSTPCDPDGDGRTGLLTLGLDVSRVRDILSLYNSPKSPIWGYPRSDEVRYSYIFDTEGWMLFQSEPVEQPNAPLSTYLARSGLEGALGRPGFDVAFRPSSSNQPYWQMITDVRERRFGLIAAHDDGINAKEVKNYYMAYAPVYFSSAPGQNATVHWGLAFVDRSKLTMAAGYRHLDLMFVVTLSTIFVIAAIILVISRILTRPIMNLARSVAGLREKGKFKPLVLTSKNYETRLLTETINGLIEVICRQGEDLARHEQALMEANLKERAPLEDELPAVNPGLPGDSIPEIVGFGPKIDRLKSEIIKAASVDVDVLVVGETGTGKQLAAEAVHAHSRRAGRPFISINCGALDENLLLDTLFGHVKGAFTEARLDRKGAFLEANGGTLFLDEIQSASPRVQQSLLRALAMRRIKPLGSDDEIEVDVRVIAATNADLVAGISRGEFREDLYFRLKVVSIHTPPLREHPESIPSLAWHYLRNAERLAARQGLALSRGALEKLRTYDWPGNIRELVNAITRAAVMSDHAVIQAADIHLEAERTEQIVPWPLEDLDEMAVEDVVPAAEPAAAQPRGAEPGQGSGREGATVDKTAERPADKAPDKLADRPTDKSPDRSVDRSTDRPRERTADRDAPSPARPAQAQPGPGSMSSSESPAPPARRRAAAERPAGPPPGLNPRQEKAWPHIAAMGRISRADYEEMVGGDLPSRTAVYDLQDMVRRGLLQKTGRGPATRYEIAS